MAQAPSTPPSPVAGEEPSGAERALVQALGVQGWRVIKRDGGTLVARGVRAGEGVVVKWWARGGLWAGLKADLGMSRAHRHVRGSALLARAGVRVPRVIEHRRLHTGPARGELIVMEDLPGQTLLEVMSRGDLGPSRQHVLARSVGGLIDRLVSAGLFNRDGKPSNIIVLNPAGPGEPELAFIDTVAVRRTRLGPPSPVMMLRNLVLEPLGCGVLPRRALLMRAFIGPERQPRPGEAAQLGQAEARRAWREHRNRDWRLVVRLVEDHGDPRPRVNPLKP
jgi:hypothetical protein